MLAVVLLNKMTANCSYKYIYSNKIVDIQSIIQFGTLGNLGGKERFSLFMYVYIIYVCIYVCVCIYICMCIYI
jgi:hypothetical protein